jgi:hypothetical protein
MREILQTYRTGDVTSYLAWQDGSIERVEGSDRIEIYPAIIPLSHITAYRLNVPPGGLPQKAFSRKRIGKLSLLGISIRRETIINFRSEILQYWARFHESFR